jgi:hypothetical protein
MKNIIFKDVMLYSPAEVRRLSGYNAASIIIVEE